MFLWIATELRQWTETVNTDQNGRYTATVPAGSRVFASSFDAPDTEQPCLASTVVTRPVTLDVQVSSPVPYRPALTEGPLVSGFVYEMRPEGRRPLEGVYVSVDGANDVWVAWTRTDRDGRFFLCRVDAPVNMVASGIEHGDSWHAIAGTGDLNLEIELKRR